MSTAHRQAVIVASATSRHGREAFERIPGLLLERGIEVAQTYCETSHSRLRKRVKRAVKHGAELIVVCGGDGTQTSVVPYLAHSTTVLGVVPAGTGNSFAYGLGLTGDLVQAADAIAYGRIEEIDLGKIDDTYFANFVTVGLASAISADTPHGLKRIVGPLAYGLAGVIPILAHKPFRARFRWAKQRVNVETHQIIIANGRFYGHTPIVPDASLNDGRLTIFVRETGSLLAPFETYLAFVRGEQAKLSGVHLWSTDEHIHVSTKPKQPIALDGRPHSKGSAKLSVARRALRVMVPLDATTLS